MITIQAPITVYQFDELRFARMEEALANMRSDVEQMREELQEVLANRQADIDAVTAELKKDVDAQQAATAADTQPPKT